MLVVERLVWTKQNIDHIARHDVTPQEVEEVCHSEFALFDAKHGRFLLIGPTKSGRAITVVLDPESKENVYYPVTAHSSDRKERRMYTLTKGVTL